MIWKSVRALLLVGIAVLYASSFHQPAMLMRLVSHANNMELPAGFVVKTGTQMAFASLFAPIFANFAGLANPLLYAGCVLLLNGQTRAALKCLGAAVLLALQSFQLFFAPYHEDEGDVMRSYLVHPLLGWYCWFGAMVLALLVALWQRRVDAAGAKEMR